MSVKNHGVVGQFETEPAGHLVLALLDGLVEKLLNVAAIKANDVIMVGTTIEFKDGVAALEVVSLHKPGTFELGQYPVDSREADLLAVFKQHPVDIFSAEVLLLALFEDFQNLHSRQRDLETGLAYVVVIHRVACLSKGRSLLYSSDVELKVTR